MFQFKEASLRLSRITHDRKLEFNYGITVRGDYDPGRPPTPCSNPDSPAFSDSGDPGSLEITGVVWVGDIVITRPNGEDPSYSHLDGAHADLIQAIAHSEQKEADLRNAKEPLWEKVFALASVGGQEYEELSRLHQQTTDLLLEQVQYTWWLMEALASRLGLGTFWELTGEEYSTLEDSQEIWDQADKEMQDAECGY